MRAPDVHRAAEVLFSMDWSLHLFYAEAPVIIIIALSHAISGVGGSCAIRGRLESDTKDGDEGSDDMLEWELAFPIARVR